MISRSRAPAFRPGLIDRFLVVLQQGGVNPVVCLNKADLLTDEGELSAVLQRLEVYRASAEVLVTSTASGAGITQLR
ncbi:MAG: ribosome biogenesis GTPase [Chlamydiales bacterium]